MNILLNEIGNEFIQVEREFVVPAIPVTGLSLQQRRECAALVQDRLPDICDGYRVLDEAFPVADSCALQLVRELPGRYFRFVSLLRVDFKFGGDPLSVISPGGVSHYPSYSSNRFYLQCRLLPLVSPLSEKGTPEIFRLQRQMKVDSDQFFHTFALFDEISESAHTARLLDMLPFELWPFSVKIYPFIRSMFFSAGLAVPDPEREIVEQMVVVAEPICAVLADRFQRLDDDQKHGLAEALPDMLELREGRLNFSDKGLVTAKDLLSRYSVYTDEELMLKRWRKINVS